MDGSTENTPGKSHVGLIVLLAILAVVAVVAIYYIVTYNALVRMDESVKSAWGDVESVYQRRLDLIPNLVATVKGYAAHEKTTLQAVVDARAKVGGIQVDAGKLVTDAQKFQQFQQAQAELSSAISRLLVVVERYPDLKASANFLHLQDELAGTENRIAVARKRYNDAARAYNTRRRGFLARMVADRSGFQEVQYFQAEKQAASAPKVSFP